MDYRKMTGGLPIAADSFARNAKVRERNVDAVVKRQWELAIQRRSLASGQACSQNASGQGPDTHLGWHMVSK